MKSGITYIISHNYTKVNVDSYDSLPLDKTSFHDVEILIKSVFKKNFDNNYYNKLWEKALYKLLQKWFFV